MDDDSSDSGSHRMFSAIEFLSGAEKAELRLSWKEPKQIELIDFYPPPGTFDHDVTVTITPYPVEADVYITFDGTDPDQNSILYTGPFVIDTSDFNYQIRAKAYAQYWLPSEVHEAYYFTSSVVVRAFPNALNNQFKRQSLW